MRLWYNFLKDMRLSSKSLYFYMEIGFTLIIIAVLLFAVPENFESNMAIYVHSDIESSFYDQLVGNIDSQESESWRLLSSREEVIEAMEDNRNSVGLVLSMANNQVLFDFILQGYENDSLKNILQTTVETAFASQAPQFEDYTFITTLDPSAERLSDRLNLIPLVLTLNVSFMGLFVIAAYIFLDKEEGTIKALAVSPNRMWEYLLGKVGVIMVSGILSGFLLLFALVGPNAHYGHFFILLVATNLFGSALGLFISSFFDTLVKAMGWLFMSVFILAFAGTSYFMPAFSPLPIRLLPSYPMLFAFREILLENPDLSFVYATSLGFLAIAVVVFLVANHRFERTLTV